MHLVSPLLELAEEEEQPYRSILRSKTCALGPVQYKSKMLPTELPCSLNFGDKNTFEQTYLL